MYENISISFTPWKPQDLLDDLQAVIDEEPDIYPNWRRVTLCEARDYLKEFFNKDAVPVVRCKDCIRRWDSSECPMCFEETIDWDDDGYMETECVTHDYTADWGFCDRGERKDDGENESE